MTDYFPPNHNSWPAPALHPRRDALVKALLLLKREAERTADRQAWCPYSDEAAGCGAEQGDAAEPDGE